MEKSDTPVLYFVEVNGMYVCGYNFQEQVCMSFVDGAQQNINSLDKIELTSELRTAKPIESERLARIIAKRINGEVYIYTCSKVGNKENNYGQQP